MQYLSQKTNAEVILPVKPAAWDLLKKYNVRFDGDTNQETNRKLKITGAMACIMDVVSEGDLRILNP